MAANDNASKGLNVLCIDGGGIGGMSSLFVLFEIMSQLHGIDTQQQSSIPADYFDVIAGTGTGGFSACMLGRLRMSTSEGVRAFIKLANDGFSRKYIGTSGRTIYKGTALRDALKSIVRDATGNEDTPMQDSNPDRNSCKTLVFAMSKHHVDASVPVLFRSYLTNGGDTPTYSIWEALYATMAHPDLFKAIDVMHDSINQPLICAELGCGNPIAHVLTEVSSIYPDRQVSCILSIGSGRPRVIHIPKPNSLQRLLWTPNQTTAVLANVATDSENIKEQMAARFRNTAQLYYRFNVDQGLQTLKEDWTQQSEVKAHTAAYLAKVEVKQMISQAAQSIKERANVLPVTYIDGTVQIPLMEQALVIKDCPAPTPTFTGREDQVQQVGNCIAGNSDERRICVVYGMGGAGKTQLALKAIEKHRETWKHVLYIDGSSKKGIEGALRDFAKTKGSGKTFSDALIWLGSCRDPLLLLFDNADHPLLDIHTYFPRGDHGSILITTRRPALGILARGPGSVCHVSEMSQSDGLELFLRVARARYQDLAEDEIEAAYALLKDFGYLALAIVHAGAYIAYTPHLSISQYRELFLLQRQEMLEQYSGLETIAKLDDYGKSVYTTWKLCYDLLPKTGDARPTLWLIGYLNHDDIRPEIFRRAALNALIYKPQLRQTVREQDALQYMRGYLGRFLNPDGSWNALRFSNTMSELASYSLVEFDRVNQAYRVHVLIQDWARTSNSQSQDMAQECSTWLLSLSVDRFNTVESRAFNRKLRSHLEGILSRRGGKVGAIHARGFKKVYTENGNWERAAALQNELLEARKEELGEEHPETLMNMNDLALTYQYQGRWDEAESLQKQALDARKRVLGDEHPDTLTSMNNLGLTYQSQSRWDEARALQEQVLNARKRVLGEDHPGTLTSMHNLALTYQSQGRSDEALLLQEQELKACKRVLGEDHPDTLTSMHNLALTYQDQGRWDEAQSLQEQDMNACKRVLGDDHPDTLTSMRNLARTYKYQGLRDEAELLHEQVLNGRKRVLEEDHPGTLASMSDLALMYQDQGRWDEAQSLQEQVLNAHKRALGEEHPGTLTSMKDLALTYKYQGRCNEAESLQEQVLDAHKRVLGEEHPQTLASMSDLALTYQSQGRWDEAQLLHEQALNARKRVRGEDHPETLASMNNLARTYKYQGRREELRSLQEQAMHACKRVLGEDHLDTLMSMQNLARTYKHQGRWDEAQSLQEQVLNAHKRVLGDEHPDTLTNMNNLARTYKRHGRWDEAELLHEQALNARKRVLGEEHPHTLISMSDLALTHQSQGRWDEAQSLHEQALNSRKRVLGEEHPETLTSMHNLARTYQNRGRWDEALLLQEQELNICKRVLGEDHPDTLTSIHNLARTYKYQGRWDEAQALQEQDMNACKRVLGEDHPGTLMSMNNLARTYQDQRRWDEAQSLHEQVLNTRKRVLGGDHPDTLTSMHNLALTCLSQGRLDLAQLLQEQALNARKRVLGEEHPDTLNSIHCLSSTYAQLGRLDESEQLAKAVDASKHIFGDQHSTVV